MIKNQKPTGRAMSMPGGLAVGAAVSIGVTLASCVLLTKLILSGALNMDQIGYGVMVLLLAASFLGALTAQGRVKHQRSMVCMLSGLVYYLMLLCTTALFFGGQYSGVGVTGLLVLGGAGTAALAAAGKGTPRRNQRKWKHGMGKI